MYACRFDDPSGSAPGWIFEDGQGELATWEACEVPALLGQVEEANRAGLLAAGFVSYEAAPGLDPALSVGPAGDGGVADLPLAWFGLFGSRRPLDGSLPRPAAGAAGVAGAAGAAGGEAPAGGACRWQWQQDKEWYGRAVRTVQERIAAGWTYQANLTTHLTGRAGESPAALYARLMRGQAGAYGALLEREGWAVVCASPELFFCRDGDRLVTRPMKGTAARQDDERADRRAAEELVASPKERAENLMIVDLVRNDLGRLAPFGRVTVPALFEVERYPSVWQMTSTVEARVGADCSLTDTFRALFPCGSVTGAPKRSTMALLAELERGPRGAYCGAVGWSAPAWEHPSQRFAVAIRTAVVNTRTGEAEFGVGSGITCDSTVDREWAELEAKAAMLGDLVAR